MKKIVASTALAALLAPYAGADTTVVTAHEEPAVVVEQAPEECCTPDFGGISFILGIGGSFMKAELKNKDKTVYTTFEKSSKNVNRFIGTIGLGGGKVFKNVFYVGAEVLFDFTKNKEYTLTQDITDASNAKLKSNGLFTSLGLRLGYIMPKYNTMIYFKVSGSHSTAKARIDATALAAATPNVDMKASKIVPTLALGVEKAFCKKFTARLEGEYRFKSTKKDNGLELKANFTDRYEDYYVSNNIKFRYYAHQTINVFTSDLEKVRNLQNSIDGELLQHDIISSTYASYEYNGLNEIKPSMIAESLEKARESAEEFAKNSHSKIGKMRTASQGYFEINDLDENTPQVKKVRVVTTVEYYLK